jgi:hypothetical protein
MTGPLDAIPDRMRSLIATLVQAGHQINIEQGFEAIATLRSAAAQLAGLRATLDLIYNQTPTTKKAARAKRGTAPRAVALINRNSRK